MKKVGFKGGDFAETAYNTTATFGRVVAFFQMISGIFIGTILFIIGVMILRSKQDPSKESQSNNKGVGIIFLLIGLLIFIGSIVWFIITLQYKVAAAATGALTAVNWTTNAVMD
jgi:hypothetical protein